MKDFGYLIDNFFTHKDYLADPRLIPGTLFTPLHFIFAGTLALIIIFSAIYVSRHKQLIKPVFTFILFYLVILEVLIITWDSLSGKTVGWDLKTNLSLYPCSIFMYVMPFAIWGKGMIKHIACSSVCTLGLLGALVNFFYPGIQLTTYSCISFPGFHTFTYHGCMLFTCLVMLISGYHRYSGIHKWWQLFLPCIPSLIVSVPANIANYSSLKSDYMFFRGDFVVVKAVFGDTKAIFVTLALYMLYIFIPALFYLPSYIRNKQEEFRAKYETAEAEPVLTVL